MKRKGIVRPKKGIISEDMIHRIDSMNDEADLEKNPYIPRKKTIIENNKLFENDIYEEKEESGAGGSSTLVLIGVIGVVVVIAIVTMIIIL